MPLISDPDGLSQGANTAVSDAVFTGASGATITITSAGTNLPAVTAGDYIEVRDSATANNNGLYLVTGSPTTGSIDLTKQATTGAVANPANAASAAIRVFGSNANEKNIFIDRSTLRITFLNGFGSVTVLDNQGVTGQALYSFLKEEWKDDNDLVRFLFPMEAITPEQFEFRNGWLPVDESESSISTTDASNTRQLIRSAGWVERDANNFIRSEYFGWVTLGNVDPGNRAYYFFDNETAATTAVFDGPVNEAVQFTFDGAQPTGLDFATTSTITRSAGSFITDGYLVGDRVAVQNPTVAGNAGSFEITNVAATTLTVSGTPFTTGADAQAILTRDKSFRVFTCRVRNFGNTYDESTTTAIGISELVNNVQRFPLSESTDNVITDLATSETAGNVATLLSNITGGATAPYNDMSIAYFAAAQDRSGFNAVGGDTPAPGTTQFGVIIDGDVSQAQQLGGGVATAEQIYAYVQARLQQTVDINNGAGAAVVTVIGQLAEELLSLASTGNTLSSVQQSSNPGGDGNGVYVDSFNSNDTNRVQFIDNDGDTRAFPFVASASILFNENLSTDTDAVFRVFFTNDDAGDNTGRDFGTENAIFVQDNTLTDLLGAVPQLAGGSSFGFSYDYDGNVQRGAASAGTDVPLTIVAIGLNTGQYVVATGTLTRATGQSFSLVAPLERNFNNP